MLYLLQFVHLFHIFYFFSISVENRIETVLTVLIPCNFIKISSLLLFVPVLKSCIFFYGTKIIPDLHNKSARDLWSFGMRLFFYEHQWISF